MVVEITGTAVADFTMSGFLEDEARAKLAIEQFYICLFLHLFDPVYAHKILFMMPITILDHHRVRRITHTNTQCCPQQHHNRKTKYDGHRDRFDQ